MLKNERYIFRTNRKKKTKRLRKYLNLLSDQYRKIVLTELNNELQIFVLIE